MRFGSLRVVLTFWLFVLVSAHGVFADGEASVDSTDQSLALGLIDKVNAFRVGRGLKPFLMSEVLNKAAATHSNDMSSYGFFDHISPVPGRQQPHDRARFFGYPSATISENLFYAQGTPEGAILDLCFQAWADSPGHLRNLIDRSRTDIGVGIAVNSQGETYVTAIFGSP